MLNGGQLKQLRRHQPSGRNRLDKAIELAKVTQVQVAEAIGSTQPYISSIVNGQYGQAGLPLETTRRLAEFFGCAIEDLFPRTEARVA